MKFFEKLRKVDLDKVDWDSVNYRIYFAVALSSHMLGLGFLILGFYLQSATSFSFASSSGIIAMHLKIKKEKLIE
jgi:hypothetical protein